MLLAIGLHAVSQFWLLSLLARYCDATLVGNYVLGFSIATPLVMFLSFRLRIVLANAHSGTDPTWPLVRFRALTSLAIVVAVAAIARLLFGWGTAAIIMVLVGAIKSAEAFSDICYGGFQRLGKGLRAERSMIRRSLLTLLSPGIAIALTHDGIIGLLVVLIIWALNAYLDLRQLHSLNPPAAEAAISPGAVVTLAERYLPLGLAALLISVAFNLPRYFLGAYVPPRQLAYYGVAAYFGLFTLMLANAATEALLPNVTRRHAASLRDGRYLDAVRRIYRLICAAGAISLLLGLTLGSKLLTLFFGADYAAHLDVLLIVQFASVFGALTVCQGHVVIALGAYREQMIAALTCFALLAVASAWLVPRYGIVGAAWADVLYALTFFAWIEAIVHRRGRAEVVA